MTRASAAARTVLLFDLGPAVAPTAAGARSLDACREIASFWASARAVRGPTGEGWNGCACCSWLPEAPADGWTFETLEAAARCPVCGKPADPSIRARRGLRDGRV